MPPASSESLPNPDTSSGDGSASPLITPSRARSKTMQAKLVRQRYSFRGMHSTESTQKEAPAEELPWKPAPETEPQTRYGGGKQVLAE